MICKNTPKLSLCLRVSVPLRLTPSKDFSTVFVKKNPSVGKWKIKKNKLALMGLCPQTPDRK
jgi:hypothetical protein